MPDPATATLISGVNTALSATLTIIKFIHELKSTPTDVKTCLDLVSRVDEDIQYAIALRGKHLRHLSSTPDELKRLDRIIASATESILDVGRLLERCRREANGGQVPIAGRVRWVLGDSTAFSRRTANLQQQHAAVNGEITHLRNLGALQPVRDILVSNTTFENPELLSMGRRKSASRLAECGQVGMWVLSLPCAKWWTWVDCEADLIDLNPPPEYSPPVPPHDEEKLTKLSSPQILVISESTEQDSLPSPQILTTRENTNQDAPQILTTPDNTEREIFELPTDQSGTLSWENYDAPEPTLSHANYLEEEDPYEDPEAEFYRSLRQQEEERRERRERFSARSGKG
jgi:hypothetical protein